MLVFTLGSNFSAAGLSKRDNRRIRKPANKVIVETLIGGDVAETIEGAVRISGELGREVYVQPTEDIEVKVEGHLHKSDRKNYVARLTRPFATSANPATKPAEEVPVDHFVAELLTQGTLSSLNAVIDQGSEAIIGFLEKLANTEWPQNIRSSALAEVLKEKGYEVIQLDRYSRSDFANFIIGVFIEDMEKDFLPSAGYANKNIAVYRKMVDGPIYGSDDLEEISQSTGRAPSIK